MRERKTQYVMREKEVLMMINHPFFIRLHYTFQDSDRLCILENVTPVTYYCYIFLCEEFVIKIFLRKILLLVQEEKICQLLLMANECAGHTGNLPLGVLLRNSLFRIIDLGCFLCTSKKIHII